MKSPLLLTLIAASIAASAIASDPSLTIYNQNFAVVRDTIPLDLNKGVNEVKFDGATLHLEPDSDRTAELNAPPAGRSPTADIAKAAALPALSPF